VALATIVESIIHVAPHKLNEKRWPIFFALGVNSLLQRTLLKNQLPSQQ